MADGRHIESHFLAISWLHIDSAAILKIALSSYLSRYLSDFDQIWYTDTNFYYERADLTKNRNFSNSRWRTDAILKIVFWLYLGAILPDQRKIR